MTSQKATTLQQKATTQENTDTNVLLTLDDKRLTEQQNWWLRHLIASWAMEDMHATAEDIDGMVRLTLGLVTEEEAIAEAKAQARQYIAEQQKS